MIADKALSLLNSGAVVECGTWRGGMSAALMEIGGPARTYMFFDSFEGLPPAQEIDGQTALEFQRKPDTPSFHNNCTVSLEEFTAIIARVPRKPPSVQVHKGFFAQSFATLPPSPPIALLRLDADWYSSTMECLEKFWDAVMPGGIILIDDYGTWDGCGKAVHDFLSSRKVPEVIRRGRLADVSYIMKRPNAED